jgi:hypothetical protein
MRGSSQTSSRITTRIRIHRVQPERFGSGGGAARGEAAAGCGAGRGVAGCGAGRGAGAG